MTHYTYLLILAFTLSYPLYKSFEEKINYAGKWRYLWPALFVSASIFISWDIWFTSIGVWSFDPEFVLGFYISGLPVEEWCFFFIIPFSSIFIYEVMNYFVKKDVLGSASKYISVFLILFLVITGIIFIDKLYTPLTFFSLAIFIFLHQFVFRSAWMGRYYLSWAICMIPFLLVDGVLTATVINYNNHNIMGLRIYDIPLEDMFYGMLNILLVVSIYEYQKRKQTK